MLLIVNNSYIIRIVNFTLGNSFLINIIKLRSVCKIQIIETRGQIYFCGGKLEACTRKKGEFRTLRPFKVEGLKNSSNRIQISQKAYSLLLKITDLTENTQRVSEVWLPQF